MLVGVEAAHQADSVRVNLALEQVHSNWSLCDGFACEPNHGNMELQGLLGHRPGIRLDTYQRVGRPERNPGGDGLDLTVGVPELQLCKEVHRLRGLW